MASYVIVVVVAMAILGSALSYSIERHFDTEIRDGLHSHASLLKDLIESRLVLSPTIDDLDDTCRQFAVEMDARITVRDAHGRIVGSGDSRRAVLDADNQEPMRSITEGFACRVCHGPTGDHDEVKVSVPLAREGRIVGRIEMAASGYEVQRTVGKVKHIVLVVLVLTTMITIFIGTRLAAGIGGPISHMNRMALKMAGGDLSQRVAVESRDEIGQLAQSLNVMADRLHDNLNQLAQEKSKLEMILTTMADPIIVTDRDGRVTLFNPASERLFGITQDRMIGHKLSDYRDLRDVDSIVRHALSEGKTVRRELDVTMPAALEVNAYASPVNDQDGNTTGVVVVLRDVTEYRRLVEMRKEFVANASHELRTPVASVRAIVGALQSGALDDPDAAERFLGSLDSEIDRLSQLLEDLLNLSELESGKKRLHKTMTNLRGAVEEASRDLRAGAESFGLAISNNVPAELTAFVDPQQIRQVMVNLLDNAIKYTPDGGSIEVFGREAGNLVTVSVRDTGVGIPMQDIDRIFERFYRVDKARSRMMGGTGLGLTIVQEIAQAHGGRVMVDSEIGQGSTFTVVLPKLQADDGPPGGLRPLW